MLSPPASCCHLMLHRFSPTQIDCTEKALFTSKWWDVSDSLRILLATSKMWTRRFPPQFRTCFSHAQHLSINYWLKTAKTSSCYFSFLAPHRTFILPSLLSWSRWDVRCQLRSVSTCTKSIAAITNQSLETASQKFCYACFGKFAPVWSSARSS